MTPNDSSMNDLLAKRGREYGETWRLTGVVMGVLQEPFCSFLANASWMSHNWVQILGKLIRILYSPHHKDHWRDIIGYATLIYDELEKKSIWNDGDDQEPG